MNVLHICRQNWGGAGKAAQRLHQGLSSIGCASEMLVLHRNNFRKNIVRFEPKFDIFRQVRHRVRHVLFDVYDKTRPEGSDFFSHDRSAHDIAGHPLVKDADVIHLHWVVDCIEYGEFFARMHKKPIVWTLHDMNPFTGGCHYSSGCPKYSTGCGACHQLGSGDPEDQSKKILKRKQKAYKGRNICFVAPSEWLKDCAKKSQIIKNFKIDVIPHGIPTRIFKKNNRNFSRKILDLPLNKTLICFGVDHKIKRKGLKYLLEALKLLNKEMNSPDIALVTFGQKQSSEILRTINIPFYQLGYLHDELLLSTVYSSADLLVTPTLQESFGLICLESMACGTPVVGFDIGGLKDIISPGWTGLLAEPENVKELARKIKYMITHPEERRMMGENARRDVEKNYSFETQAERYREIYNRSLDRV